MSSLLAAITLIRSGVAAFVSGLMSSVKIASSLGFNPAVNALPPLIRAAVQSGRRFASVADSASSISI